MLYLRSVVSNLSKNFRPFFDHRFFERSAKVRAFIYLPKFFFRIFEEFFSENKKLF